MADTKTEMPEENVSPVGNNTQWLVWALLAVDDIGVFAIATMMEDSWQRSLLIAIGVMMAILLVVWALMLSSTSARAALRAGLPTLAKGGHAESLLNAMRAGGFVDPARGDAIVPRLSNLAEKDGTVTVNTQKLADLIRGVQTALQAA